jgi:hypothetical protein
MPLGSKSACSRHEARSRPPHGSVGRRVAWYFRYSIGPVAVFGGCSRYSIRYVRYFSRYFFGAIRYARYF